MLDPCVGPEAVQRLWISQITGKRSYKCSGWSLAGIPIVGYLTNIKERRASQLLSLVFRAVNGEISDSFLLRECILWLESLQTLDCCLYLVLNLDHFLLEITFVLIFFNGRQFSNRIKLLDLRKCLDNFCLLNDFQLWFKQSRVPHLRLS